jgi:hypothetical protein
MQSFSGAYFVMISRLYCVRHGLDVRMKSRLFRDFQEEVEERVRRDMAQEVPGGSVSQCSTGYMSASSSAYSSNERAPLGSNPQVLIPPPPDLQVRNASPSRYACQCDCSRVSFLISYAFLSERAPWRCIAMKLLMHGIAGDC